MSITNSVNAPKIAKYAWNFQNFSDNHTLGCDSKDAACMAEYNRTEGWDVYINYTHVYVQRCYLLVPFEPWYLIMSMIYTLASVVWIVYTFCICKISNYNIQKWFTIIPVFKAMWLMQMSLYYFTCPWDSEDTLYQISIFIEQILSILTVICSSTVLNGLFYLVSLGWGTTVQ